MRNIEVTFGDNDFSIVFRYVFSVLSINKEDIFDNVEKTKLRGLIDRIIDTAIFIYYSNLRGNEFDEVSKHLKEYTLNPCDKQELASIWFNVDTESYNTFFSVS